VDAIVLDLETPIGRMWLMAFEYGHPKASKAAWSRLSNDPEIRHRHDMSVWNTTTPDRERHFAVVVTESLESMERAIEVAQAGGDPESVDVSEWPEEMVESYVNRRVRGAVDVLEGDETTPIERHFGADGIRITRSGRATLDDPDEPTIYLP
jgi:hypothetical protein